MFFGETCQKEENKRKHDVVDRALRRVVYLAVANLVMLKYLPERFLSRRGDLIRASVLASNAATDMSTLTEGTGLPLSALARIPSLASLLATRSSRSAASASARRVSCSCSSSKTTCCAAHLAPSVLACSLVYTLVSGEVGAKSSGWFTALTRSSCG